MFMIVFSFDALLWLSLFTVSVFDQFSIFHTKDLYYVRLIGFANMLADVRVCAFLVIKHKKIPNKLYIALFFVASYHSFSL